MKYWNTRIAAFVARCALCSGLLLSLCCAPGETAASSTHSSASGLETNRALDHRSTGGTSERPAPSPDAADDQYLFATELFGKQMYELAIQQYERFVGDYPGHPKAFQARLRMAEANLRLGRHERAIKAYETALATRPDTAFRGEALVGLGIALFNAKQYDRAADALAEARPLVGDDKTLGPVAANWMGEALFQQGRYADAARAYEAVLRWPQSPHAPQALYSLGFCQLKQEKTTEAVATFQRLAKEYPKSPLAVEALTRAGEALVRETKYDAAQALFESARKSAGGASPEALADADWGLAGVAYARKQYAEARRRYEAFRRDHPRSARVPEAALRIGDCLYGEQQYAAAAKAYEAAAAHAGDGTETAREAHYWAGMARWKAGDPDAAAMAFRALAPEGAKDACAQRARLRLGELEAGRGNETAAVAAYQECVRADPSSDQAAAASYALATLAYRARRLEEAEKAFAAFVERYPKHPRAPAARLGVAHCRWDRKEFAGAREALESAIDSGGLAPESHANALLLLGRCHERLGDDAKAEVAWKAVVETYPKSAAAPRALAALAEHYTARGRAREAERAQSDLSERYPKSPATAATRRRAGDAERQAGRYDAAIRHYQAALAAEPEPAAAASIRLSLAAAYLRLEKPDAALAECRRLLDASPDEATSDRARLMMAAAHEKQGRRDEAVALYRAVAERQPASPVAPQALLQWGRLLSDAWQYPQARATLERLLKEHPKSKLAPDALYEIGWAASEGSDPAGARAAWERLLKEHPTHALAPEAAFRLGEQEYAARRYEAAAAYYRQAARPSGSQPELDRRPAGEAREPGEGDDRAWYKLGWCYRQLGRHQAAAEAFGKVYTLYPKSELALESRLRAGEALAEQGDFSSAREQFAIVVKEGGGTEGHLLRAKLGLARTRLRAGEFEAALAELRALARTANGAVGAEAQYRIGEAFSSRKEHAKALEEFLRVTMLFGNYPAWAAPAQYQIGETHRLMGNTREAHAAYRRCVEAYGGSRWAELSRRRLQEKRPQTGSLSGPALGGVVVGRKV